MTPSWSEVNAAVMAVLGEVARPTRPVVRPSKPAREDHVFVDRLFSLRHAESVGDVEEVRVASGTVVTPLALELLRRRRIRVRFVSKGESAAAQAHQQGEWGFAIESKVGTADAIRRVLLEGWAEVGGGSIEAAHWVIEGEGRGAFVIADEASIATWRAGRVEGIRAATVGDPDAVSRAIRHLGVNLVVVEPRNQSIYQVKQIGERFRLGGAPLIPAELDETEAAR